MFRLVARFSKKKGFVVFVMPRSVQTIRNAFVTCVVPGSHLLQILLLWCFQVQDKRGSLPRQAFHLYCTTHRFYLGLHQVQA